MLASVRPRVWAASFLIACLVYAMHQRLPALLGTVKRPARLDRSLAAWSADEIALVPGVGAALAKRIHAYLRARSRGDGRRAEFVDFERVRGVGPVLAGKLAFYLLR